MPEHPSLPVQGRLGDPGRLAALRRTELLDSPVEEAFERFTRTVARALGVPVALLSLVDGSRQFFKSAVGLGEPWASLRGTALSHSFCQYVVTADAPLVVQDARTDDRLRDNLAIEDLSVVAYAGAPVHGPGGEPIGSLCAIDAQPRAWTPEDVELVRDLAELTSELIAMRTAAAERRAAVLGLSHDVRSRVTAVRLEAEDLQRLAEQPAVQHQATRVVEGLQEVSEALAAALAEAGAAGVRDQQALDLCALLDDEAGRWQSAAAAAGRSVTVAAGHPPGTRPHVPATPADLVAVLDRVVQALLEHGTGTVAVEVLTGGAAVRVRLRDDSRGLPEDVVRALTERQDADRAGGQEPSAAEQAARAFGGRLVLTSVSPTTLDLLLRLA